MTFLFDCSLPVLLVLTVPLDDFVPLFEGCWVDRLLAVVDVRLGVTNVDVESGEVKHFVFTVKSG